MSREKFWIEDPTTILKKVDIFPRKRETIEAQTNSLTRFVIIVSLILLLVDYKLSLIFFGISTLFIIILYNIQKNNMRTEEYKYIPQQQASSSCCGSVNRSKSNITYSALNVADLAKNGTIVSPQRMTFCGDSVPVETSNFVSANQRLAGGPNPKTLIPPVITPPSAALDFWRANDLINHSHINSEGNHDTYLSGYDESTCCERINACITPINNDLDMIVENYGDTMYEGISDPQRPVGKPYPLTPCQIKSPQPVVAKPYIVESYGRSLIPDRVYGQDSQIKSPKPVTMENYTETILPNYSGWVNTACGYNPGQLKNYLPSNLEVGPCENNIDMSEYNKNLFTQTIQPGEFTRTEINEPINSNIGISFTQQFPPVQCKRDSKSDELFYTEKDPRIPQKVEWVDNLNKGLTEADVYDPRFSGYGTSYRSYTDKMTGQTRYMYDDINAIRMPNYITRNNIDFTSFGDSYGPLNKGNRNGNVDTNIVKALAQDAFLRSSLQQRTELTERLMRKRNAEMWQTRKFPKRTFGGKGC